MELTTTTRRRRILTRICSLRIEHVDMEHEDFSATYYLLRKV
jgi:hypothetical protein